VTAHSDLSKNLPRNVDPHTETQNDLCQNAGVDAAAAATDDDDDGVSDLFDDITA
jgi:hypothetical protein